MRLTCDHCQVLSLCNTKPYVPQSRLTREELVANGPKTALANLLLGKAEGCAGCRLVCEVIPLLNDYCLTPADAGSLFVYQDSFLNQSRPWCIGIQDEMGHMLGQFEVFKTHDYPPKYPYDEPKNDPGPWSCVRKSFWPRYEQRGPIFDSEEAYELIAKWYSKCSSSHALCKQQRRTEGPCRLLYIDPKVSDVVSLVNCDLTAPHGYVALSHCWGRKIFAKTQRANVEEHRTGIKVGTLPRTFRDAIKICHKLGEQYIWIDSLCIIQDSDEDWKAEMPRMKAIYEGASFTISAMSAHDGRGGCWIPRSRSFEVPLGGGESINLTFERSNGLAARMHAPFLRFANEDSTDSNPLASRKWAVQERLLSRRVLHTTDEDFLWQCRTSIVCACSDNDFENDYQLAKAMSDELGRSPPSKSDLIAKWIALVEVYSAGVLTHETDVFPALVGMAHGFSERGLGLYCAGLWEAGLPLTLCWHNASRGPSPSRPSTYLAPSWSWASVTRATRFAGMGDNHEGRNVRDVAEILDVQCQTTDPNPFGSVRSGSLRLRTRTCTVGPGSIFIPGAFPGLENRWVVSGFERPSPCEELSFDDYDFSDELNNSREVSAREGTFWPDCWNDIAQQQECIVALICVVDGLENCALVLATTDDGRYRRCGLLFVPDEKMDRFVDEKVLEII